MSAIQYKEGLTELFRQHIDAQSRSVRNADAAAGHGGTTDTLFSLS